jgi:hypothetical protein
MIYETDTDLVLTYDGSAWQKISPVIPQTAGSTTSTSYTTPPTAVTISSFTKYRSDTKIIYHVLCTAYITAGAWVVYIGVNDGTNTTDVAAQAFNEAANHNDVVGTNQITGLVAGTYTFGLRWKASTGTINVNTEDFWTFSVMETL